MAQSIYRQKLMEIAQKIVQSSQGRARLTFQEDDNSPLPVADAAHFIKVDGKRVGRDIEMYGFFGDGPMGWPEAIQSFFLEVLIPVKSLGLDQSYTDAGLLLKNLGHEIFPQDIHQDWDALF